MRNWSEPTQPRRTSPATGGEPPGQKPEPTVPPVSDTPPPDDAPGTAPDAPPTSDRPTPDWTADKSPTPPSADPVGSEARNTDPTRGRFRGRGAGGFAVAAAAAGGLGLGYTLHDLVTRLQSNRYDMAPLDRLEEGRRAARLIFDRMRRQGQSEDEARATATRWVKGNFDVDVDWPEAPGFDADAVRGSRRRGPGPDAGPRRPRPGAGRASGGRNPGAGFDPNDEVFGHNREWWDNFYRGWEENPRNPNYGRRRAEETFRREQEREREWQENLRRMRERDRQRRQEQDEAQYAAWEREAEWNRASAERERRRNIWDRPAPPPSSSGINPWIPAIGVPVGITGLGLGGLAGGGYAAGRMSHDRKLDAQKRQMIEDMGWPIPQSYMAGRRHGDQSRFDQERMNMAPVDLPEMWPYADVPWPTADTPQPPADPTQVQAIQQQLLDEAGGDLTKARAAAMKLDNQRIRDLNARAKRINVGNRYGSFADERVLYRPGISDPVHIATGPFVAATGLQRERFEQLAAEYGVSPEAIARDRERLQNPRAKSPNRPASTFRPAHERGNLPPYNWWWAV